MTNNPQTQKLTFIHLCLAHESLVDGGSPGFSGIDWFDFRVQIRFRCVLPIFHPPGTAASQEYSPHGRWKKCKRANKATSAPLKLLLASHLITFHWPKQVTQPSPGSVGWRWALHWFNCEGLQRDKTKDTDIDAHYREGVKAWEQSSNWLQWCISNHPPRQWGNFVRFFSMSTWSGGVLKWFLFLLFFKKILKHVDKFRD